jgi:N-acetylneuraminic acid mutarotase
MVLWGGVDAKTALYTDLSTHPGISGEMFLYTPSNDTWKFVSIINTTNARVTLPVVKWNNQWLYISGEIRPAVRTNTVFGINY